jgi:NADP-dependent 3-hydroxy acid dehydrogenase YdfG
MNTRTSSCAVIGVGPGNGAAFARRFHAAGYPVALLARNQTYLDELAGELPGSRAYAYDARDPALAATTIERIEQECGPLDVVIYNAGSGVFGDIEHITLDAFESAWRVNALGLAALAQTLLPRMKARKQGNLVVIGATASLRGGANFAAFASAKAAQRSLAQSLARYAGRFGVHVSYVVIDGKIDPARHPQPQREDALHADDIASVVYQLTQQPRSAWTFELDLRPYAETW